MTTSVDFVTLDLSAQLSICIKEHANNKVKDKLGGKNAHIAIESTGNMWVVFWESSKLKNDNLKQEISFDQFNKWYFNVLEANRPFVIDTN